MTFPIYK